MMRASTVDYLPKSPQVQAIVSNKVPMSQKLKIAGWLTIGALTGALTTFSLQTVARANMTPLPLEELQQLAAVFSMVKSTT
jgi:hypothetical protein